MTNTKISDWNDKIKTLNSLKGIEKLQQIMAMLRDPEHGCPWDLKQDFQSIVPYTIEEAYEVADAIEQQNFNELKLELGDLLFQTIFYAQLGKEQNLFDFNDITEGICEKLIRRHPHVFLSGENQLSDQQIKANWEQEKSKERQQKSDGEISVLDDIPKAKIQKRVSSVGFDWPDISGAIEKVAEEVNEVQQELNVEDIELNKEALADELGDLYFALTNVVRHLGLKPEQVVHQANQKFERRFRHVEQLAKENNDSISDLSLDKLDMLWEKAKLITPKT